MSQRVIYNCHNHLFTHENVPNDFFPFKLVKLGRNRLFRFILVRLMKWIVPWSKNDKIHRFAAFLMANYRDTQEKNLKHVMNFYPSKTKFIVLPMDMSKMGAGKVIEDIDKQHDELLDLYKNDKYKNILIPFAHIDPRRSNPLQRLKKLIEEDGFRGVKIYPTLGYQPDAPVLMKEIYPYMVEKSIPLLAHCSKGPVNSKEMSRKQAWSHADPDHYKIVMDKYPELKICLGHYGGSREWERHINKPRNDDDPTWLRRINRMIKSGDYPNLYTDISYTIFHFQKYISFLKILLEDPAILDKVLFGSDFYMVEIERYSEKRFATDLRAALGEEKFWKIAYDNPRKYLGES